MQRQLGSTAGAEVEVVLMKTAGCAPVFRRTTSGCSILRPSDASAAMTGERFPSEWASMLELIIECVLACNEER